MISCRVIDLGVMTPCEKILKCAIDERAGMTTPSLYILSTNLFRPSTRYGTFVVCHKEFIIIHLFQ